MLGACLGVKVGLQHSPPAIAQGRAPQARLACCLAPAVGHHKGVLTEEDGLGVHQTLLLLRRLWQLVLGQGATRGVLFVQLGLFCPAGAKLGRVLRQPRHVPNGWAHGWIWARLPAVLCHGQSQQSAVPLHAGVDLITLSKLRGREKGQREIRRREQRRGGRKHREDAEGQRRNPLTSAHDTMPSLCSTTNLSWPQMLLPRENLAVHKQSIQEQLTGTSTLPALLQLSHKSQAALQQLTSTLLLSCKLNVQHTSSPSHCSTFSIQLHQHLAKHHLSPQHPLK